MAKPLDYGRPAPRKDATIPIVLGVIAIIVISLTVLWFNIWPILTYFNIAD
ncbi:MAG: hypothetical protein JWN40_2811 [Phycisphaerales bacterium]|nr:hypothetical protein [Phycisphaerales bacterium]